MSEPAPNANVFGSKAAGLASLPPNWTPLYVPVAPDVIVPSGSVDAALGGAQIAARLRSSAIARDLKALFDQSPDGVIVRSSAPAEGMAARGLFSSVPITFSSFETVGDALRQVWHDAERIDPACPHIPVVVQTRIEAPVRGHLSNESRLKEDRRDWVVEMHGDLSETHTSGLRALRRDRVDPATVDLACASPDALRATLRRVAGTFTVPGIRAHLEWLWDGARLWVVQCDTLVELRSAQPRAEGEPAPIPALGVFRRPLESDVDVPKVRCVAEYISASVPCADLRILRDAATVNDLAQGTCSPELWRDLQELSDAGVVVRSDYARGHADFEVLLPRTETEHSAERLRAYLVETSRLLLDKGVMPEDVAFLTHVFIPADAAAWAVSAPQSPEVRIDATYGLPDGLLYYPHDSYVVNSRRGTVRTHERCKDTILLCDDDGAWRTSALGAPWNWRPVLSEAEALEAAQIAKRLADHLGRPVETMFFIRAHLPEAPVVALPWVHRIENVGAANIAATESHFPRRSVEVRRPEDIAVMREAFQSTPPGERVLVRLKPEGEILHDARFLSEIIAELSPEQCLVDLAGSSLSHVFYELQRAGVQVRTADPLAPQESESISFNKLVRDAIPDLIASRGERVSVYTADGEELLLLLRRKVIEEALEVSAAPSANELMEEIGDVIDVLEALCAVSGTDLDAVRSWAESKRLERGGFQRGVVLRETRDTSLEDALRQSAGDYAVDADLGVEVERAREAGPPVRFSVDDSINVPLESLVTEHGLPVQLSIGNEAFHVRLTADGLSLERVGPTGKNPDQLTLRL